MASKKDEWNRITQLRVLTLGQSLNSELPIQDWLIPKFIPASGTIAVLAPPGIDTQPFALLLAYGIAGGKIIPPLGQGAGVPVLFCSGNGDQHEDKSLLKLISQKDPRQNSRDLASQNLHIYQREYQNDEPVFLDTQEGQRALRKSMPEGCKLIVLDDLRAWSCGKFARRDDLTKVSPWLSALNRDGISVLFVERVTKNGANTSTLVRKPSNIIQLTKDPAAPTKFGGGFNVIRKKTDFSDMVPSMFRFWYKVVNGRFDFGWECSDLSDATSAKQVEIIERQMEVESLLLLKMEQKAIAVKLEVDAATISRDVAALRARKSAATAAAHGSPVPDIDLDSDDAYWAGA